MEKKSYVTYVAAFGLQAIDMLVPDFRDEAWLRAQARRGMQMGYAGMQVIQPEQVAPVQEIFTPNEGAIRYAQRLLEAYEATRREGRGAFALDGKMVDMPAVKAAEQVLERARAAGKI